MLEAGFSPSSVSSQVHSHVRPPNPVSCTLSPEVTAPVILGPGPGKLSGHLTN